VTDLKLPAWARELLEGSAVGRLGLVDGEGRPRVLPVTFVVHAGAAWSAVDDKPKRVPGPELARVRWLRERPEAALCVDRYSDDWSRLAWVQLLGRIAVVEAQDAHAALEALAAKYPPYRQRPPAGPLLRLDVDRALRWRAG
jgi:PPOX class probable F420-dependent enzyme